MCDKLTDEDCLETLKYAWGNMDRENFQVKIKMDGLDLSVALARAMKWYESHKILKSLKNLLGNLEPEND
jgi:hypothetical protein